MNKKFYILGLVGLIAFGIMALRQESSESQADPMAGFENGITPKWGEGPKVDHYEFELGSMIQVPSGSYLLGDDWYEPMEPAPEIEVQLDAYWVDRYAVTNAQFAAFIEATSHVTDAELNGGGWAYTAGDYDWEFVAGANWRQPLGPESSIAGLDDHPVVMVSWNDAASYARWAGKRLLTESEWEVAARGGLSKGQVAVVDPTKDRSANVWVGTWPDKNNVADGYFYTAPVGAYKPNRLGIYQMIGNTWEWTHDWYTEDQDFRRSDAKNPHGPATGFKRCARGGSWFCSENYCSGYRPGYRGKSPQNYAFNNVGFRCAKDIKHESNQKT